MNKERWHFMGIGGQGISAVAQMVLEARGNNVVVSGCDMQASATTRALQDIGVPVEIGHSPDHLVDIDKLVVVPVALVLNPDHPELLMARARGIPLGKSQYFVNEADEFYNNFCHLQVRTLDEGK